MTFRLWRCFFLMFLFRIFSGRFDISGSMIPRLVPEISPLDAFCDIVVAGVVVGIGDSRSWMKPYFLKSVIDLKICVKIYLSFMKQNFLVLSL